MANKQGLKIFLSHASEDTRKAEELNLALLQDGHEVFFDRHSLPAGVGFHSAIRNEIFKADLFLFLVSPAALTEGRYTLTELTFAEERWHNPSGRILPVMVSKTDFDTLPPYLKAVTVFRAKGNLAAEVVDCIEGLLAKGLLTPDDSSSRSAPGDLTETYHDAQVESVRTQLIQLLPQPGDEEIFLRNKVFPILRTLFVGRNTFEEKVAECRDEVWTRRFIAAVETRQLMNAYKTKMVKLAKPGDDRLVQSYDQLKLHLYLQKLTGLFSPLPEVNQVAERLRHGDLEGVEKELRKAEIHPKEKIDPKTISDCDRHQTMMRGIWKTWPVF